MTMQLEAVVASGATLTIWNKRAQDAAGALIGAGNEAIHLVHGQHHGAVIIGIEHRFARLLFLDALETAQQLVAFDESRQIFAFGGIDDADAFQRDIQFRGGLFDLGAVAQQDGRAQAQGIELARGLEDAGFGPFRENDPLGVPLQLFNNSGDKSHRPSSYSCSGKRLKFKVSVVVSFKLYRYQVFHRLVSQPYVRYRVPRL